MMVDLIVDMMVDPTILMIIIIDLIIPDMMVADMMVVDLIVIIDLIIPDMMVVDMMVDLIIDMMVDLIIIIIIIIDLLMAHMIVDLIVNMIVNLLSEMKAELMEDLIVIHPEDRRFLRKEVVEENKMEQTVMVFKPEISVENLADREERPICNMVAEIITGEGKEDGVTGMRGTVN